MGALRFRDSSPFQIPSAFFLVPSLFSIVGSRIKRVNLRSRKKDVIVIREVERFGLNIVGKVFFYFHSLIGFMFSGI